MAVGTDHVGGSLFEDIQVDTKGLHLIGVVVGTKRLEVIGEGNLGSIEMIHVCRIQIFPTWKALPILPPLLRTYLIMSLPLAHILSLCSMKYLLKPILLTLSVEKEVAWRTKTYSANFSLSQLPPSGDSPCC